MQETTGIKQINAGKNCLTSNDKYPE